MRDAAGTEDTGPAGVRPSETLSAAATYYDGLSARPHPVTLHLGDRLVIGGDGIREDWSLLDVRGAATQASAMRLGREDSPVRVEFTDARLAAALTARCPDLQRGDEARGGLVRFVLWSVAAGVSVLLAAVYGVPALAGLLAPLVPASIEARFGATVDGQVVTLLGDPPLCSEPAGAAVLDRLVARMTEGAGLPATPIVDVRRHKLANALTLPGGRVIVLSDILAKAQTPDEFAGVLAHEFGHVAAHDPTKSVITAGGVSFLLSLVLGDLTGSTLIVAVGQTAVSAGYSREAESAADAYGVAMVRRAGGAPEALATILERLDAEGDKDGATTAFLRSHPYTRERAAAIRRLASTGMGETTTDRRILSEADWQTLRAICPTGPESGAGPKAP